MHGSKLLTRLRRETAERHRQLDDGIRLELESGRPDGYSAFLAASLAALECLAALPQWLPRAAIEARCDALRGDLSDLGRRPALTFELPRLIPKDLSEAFGCAYVVEGSSLGAVTIAKRVHAALPSAPTRYLALHGPQLRAHWQAFLESVNAHDQGIEDDARARACASACATFDLFAAAFRTAGVLS